MLSLTCQCGRVRVEAAKRPEFVNECNCTLCAKSGARWAYFHPDDVGVSGATSAYRREDKPDPAAELHFCTACGATTHYVLTESAVAKFGNVMMGVNARLADEQDLAGIELRFPDGRGWPGEGPFSYVRESVRFG